MTSASAGPWMMDRCKVTAIPVNANCEADIVNVENVQLGAITAVKMPARIDRAELYSARELRHHADRTGGLRSQWHLVVPDHIQWHDGLGENC